MTKEERRVILDLVNVAECLARAARRGDGDACEELERMLKRECKKARKLCFQGRG